MAIFIPGKSNNRAIIFIFQSAWYNSYQARFPFFTGDQSTPPQWAFEGDDDEAAFMEEEKESTKLAVPKSFNETLEEMAEVAMSVGIMEKWTWVFICCVGIFYCI